MAKEQRRLAAIMAADVVGYSRLMGRHESGTLLRFREHRTQRLEPALARNGGRLVKLTGDGALVEFSSAVDALSAAIEFQQAVTEANRDELSEGAAIIFRVGVHLGDLIVDGDDLYGDGVNVAARLEAVAPAGSIVISGNMYDAVNGRLKATFTDLGNLELKNIERDVQAFEVKWDPADWRHASHIAAAPPTRAAGPLDGQLALPDRPSIAVLPFRSMGGDADQEYLADGIVEDVTTALSCQTAFFVIARNSAFTYKGRAVTVTEVGRELGVRYVVEGSVRMVGSRIRVSAQLIDSRTANQIWADRYDRDVADVFAVQDEIAQNVAAAIEPQLFAAEAIRAQSQPPTNVDAWGLVVRAISQVFRIGRNENAEAQQLASEAITLDPTYARAHSVRAWAMMWAGHCLWDRDLKGAYERATQEAERAIALDARDHWARVTLGHVLSSAGYHPRALTELETDLSINPNFALGRAAFGWALLRAGRFQDAIAETGKALRMSPKDSFAGFYTSTHALALMANGQFAEALPFIRRSASAFPEFLGIWRLLASCCGHLGLQDEAKMALRRLEVMSPGLTLAATRNQLMPHAHRDIFVEGLRLAGLPE